MNSLPTKGYKTKSGVLIPDNVLVSEFLASRQEYWSKLAVFSSWFICIAAAYAATVVNSDRAAMNAAIVRIVASYIAFGIGFGPIMRYLDGDSRAMFIRGGFAASIGSIAAVICEPLPLLSGGWIIAMLVMWVTIVFSAKGQLFSQLENNKEDIARLEDRLRSGAAGRHDVDMLEELKDGTEKLERMINQV